jgi:hypothetical protein
VGKRLTRIQNFALLAEKNSNKLSIWGQREICSLLFLGLLLLFFIFTYDIIKKTLFKGNIYGKLTISNYIFIVYQSWVARLASWLGMARFT